jgi:hypothetical protein
VALETGSHAEKCHNNPSSTGDFIEPGTCSEGVSLTEGVPVSVGMKVASTTITVGINEGSDYPVATKRFKIS